MSTMVDSKIGKTFQRSVGRAKEKILQNLGKVDRTADEILDDQINNFSKQQYAATRLQKELNNYIRCIRACATSSRALLEAVNEVYEPEWGGKELLTVNSQSVELLWNDFAHRLAEQVLIPLNTYQGQFPEMRKKIEKRGRKLVDFDGERHALQAMQSNPRRGEAKLTRQRESLEAAKRTYEVLNSELHDELPALFNSRIVFLVSAMSTLFASEHIFHSESSKVFTELEGIVEKLAKDSGKGTMNFKVPSNAVINNADSPKDAKNGNVSPVSKGSSNPSTPVTPTSPESKMAVEGNSSNPSTTSNGSLPKSNGSIKPNTNMESKEKAEQSVNGVDKVDAATHHADNPVIEPSSPSALPDSSTSTTPSANEGSNVEKAPSATAAVNGVSAQSKDGDDKDKAATASPSTPEREEPDSLDTVTETQAEHDIDRLTNDQLTMEKDKIDSNNNKIDTTEIIKSEKNATANLKNEHAQQQDANNNDLEGAMPINLKECENKKNVDNDNANVEHVGRKLKPVHGILSTSKNKVGNGRMESPDNDHDHDQARKSASEESGVLYRVRATYRYQKEDVDELSFEAGEIIRVIEYDDPEEQEEGWLMGVKDNGEKGMFPANFTRPL